MVLDGATVTLLYNNMYWYIIGGAVFIIWLLMLVFEWYDKGEK